VSNDLPTYIAVIIKRVKDTFGRDGVIYLPDINNRDILKPYADNPKFKAGENEVGAVTWAYQHQKIIGYNTDTLPDANAKYLPLVTARGVVGVMSVVGIDSAHELSPQQERLLEAYADLAAVALEGILRAKEIVA
jgi:two-component system sensor histidine kinase KdpD